MGNVEDITRFILRTVTMVLTCHPIGKGLKQAQTTTAGTNFTPEQ
jgi:hypothetical protein